MPETLLSPSGIKLYGRVVEDLAVNPVATDDLGSNNFLRNQVAADPDDNDPKLARIYGFSFEGHYYDLPKPALFLVHGPGQDAGPIPPRQDGKKGPGAGVANTGRGSVSPGDVDESGVAAKGWDFMEDLQFWEYDKGDFSIRLDVETGPLEEILLQATLDPDGLGSYQGAARVSGARVSGARVSGARVSGARVSGARVSGARVGGGGDGD